MLQVTSERLAVGLVFVAICGLACMAPTQSDTWWHLRDGLEIWRTHTVSLQDSYSYTAAGRNWPNHGWLTEAIFYALYITGGLPLLTGACAALIVAAWALSWRLTEGPFETRFLLFAGCLVTAAGSWAIRPQLFTLAGFALITTLLVRRRLAWLPILFVIWANLHGAVVLGLVAVGAALAAQTIFDRAVSRPLLVTFAACALATCVSPLGFRLWPEILASIERSRINQLIEWQAPGFGPGLWPFWAAAICLPVAAVVWRRRLDERTLTLVLIALAMLPLAATSVRNVAVFLLVAVPALTALARPRHHAAPTRRPTGEHVGVNAAILGVSAAIAAVVVALAWRAPAPALGWRPIAPAAVAAIASCGQPFYNSYGDGGVLIWFVPTQKVFIDNRQDPYPLPFLRANHEAELSGDYQPLFSQYHPRCAAVPSASPIASALTRDPAWTLSYSDARWTVLTRSQ